MKNKSKIIAQITGATIGTAIMATTVFGLERNNYYNNNAKYIIEEYANIDGSVEISENNTKEFTNVNGNKKITTGDKIYKELIDNDIKYIKINDKYYTIDGKTINCDIKTTPYSELKNYDLISSVNAGDQLCLSNDNQVAFKSHLKLSRKLF